MSFLTILSLDQLPASILRLILKYIDFFNARNVLLLNKKIYRLVGSTEFYWKMWCLQRFPEELAKVETQATAFPDEMCLNMRNLQSKMENRQMIASYAEKIKYLPVGWTWKTVFHLLQREFTPGQQNFAGFSLVENELSICDNFSNGKLNGKGIICSLKKHSTKFFSGTFSEGLQNEFCFEFEEKCHDLHPSSAEDMTDVTDHKRTDLRIFAGYFNNGERNGMGFEIENSRSYFGEWKSDTKNGKGLFSWGEPKTPWREKEHFFGDFILHYRTGNGTYSWPTGDSYTGEWKNGDQEGFGTYYWPSGSAYTGQWHLNEKHGHGTFTWPNGTTYTGEWNMGYPRNLEACTHPLVAKAIREGVCTKNVPGDKRALLGQVYYVCQSCKIRACVVCYKRCHANHGVAKTSWSSLNECKCFC